LTIIDNITNEMIELSETTELPIDLISTDLISSLKDTIARREAKEEEQKQQKKSKK
jgi:cystathionine beta-lyase family protein involved in aluminum resistance